MPYLLRASFPNAVKRNDTKCLPDISRMEEDAMTDKQKTQIIKLRAAGYGYGKIAQQLGISVNTVKSFCRRKCVNEETASKSSLVLSGKVTHCENCGQEIHQVAKQKPRRFCSDACRNQWWNSHLDLVKRKANYTLKCRHCGKVFQVYGDRERKYCSRECYLAERLKGGGCHE